MCIIGIYFVCAHLCVSIPCIPFYIYMCILVCSSMCGHMCMEINVYIYAHLGGSQRSRSVVSQDGYFVFLKQDLLLGPYE